MADEALNIVVEDEEGEVVDAGSVAANDADDPVAVLRAQIEQANAATAAEREARTAADARRQAAESDAASARSEALRYRSEVDTSQQSQIDGGLDQAKREKASARAAMKTAMDAGDSDAMADAQERLAQATVDERTYTQAKSDIDARRTAPPKQADSGDPVENMARQTDAKSAAWLRANRAIVIERGADIGRAHSHAIGEGLTPGSDEYLAHIETRIGMRQKEAVAAPAAVRSKPAPVAPVNGGGSMGGGSGGGNEVRLSKKQAEAARDGTHVWNYDDPSGKNKFKKGDPIGINEMARRVQAQTKQGLYNSDGSM